MRRKEEEFPQDRLLFQIIKEETRYNKQDLKSKSRIRELVNIRILISNIMTNQFKYSLSRIGDLMNRNHATIIYHIKQHEDFHYKHDKDYIERYDKILHRIKVEDAESETNEEIIENFKDLVRRMLINGSVNMDDRRRAEQLL